MNTEILVNDLMKRALGGKVFDANADATVVINQKLGRIQWLDTDKRIIGEIGNFGNNRFGLKIIDENNVVRFFAGKDDTFYGMKMTKDGYDVFDNEEGIILSSDKTFLKQLFTTFMNTADATNGVAVGFVSYRVTDRNLVLRLSFYKPDDIVITSASLQTILYDSFFSGSVVRLENISIYLNPISSKIDGSFDQDFIRFSGGITLNSGINPTKDKEEIYNEFNSTQIAGIQSGWNHIVLQQETSDTGLTKFGYASLGLVMDGYKIHN